MRYYQGKKDVPSVSIMKDMVKTLTHNIPLKSETVVQLIWEGADASLKYNFTTVWYKDSRGYKIIKVIAK